MCVPNKSTELINTGKSINPMKLLKSGDESTPQVKPDPFIDVLALSTHYTKKYLEYVVSKHQTMQASRIYKILFRTTQPAHVFMILAVLFVTSLWQTKSAQQEDGPGQNQLVLIVYFGAFCACLGSQFWMTFVSGLSLYFNLPRHQFGDVQRVLFPKYFAMNSFLNFFKLVIFTWYGGVHIHQAAALSLAFIINLSIRLYLTPPLLKLMAAKKDIERSVGLGTEIGTIHLGSLKNCPHYLKLHQSFRKIHMAIATGNILAMGCTVFHLYHLSKSVCTL